MTNLSKQIQTRRWHLTMCSQFPQRPSLAYVVIICNHNQQVYHPMSWDDMRFLSRIGYILGKMEGYFFFIT